MHSVLALSHHTVQAASSHLGWGLFLAEAGTPTVGPTCWGTFPELPHQVGEHLPPTSAPCGQVSLRKESQYSEYSISCVKFPGNVFLNKFLATLKETDELEV